MDITLLKVYKQGREFVTSILRKGVAMAFKQCFHCGRSFSRERFRALELHGLQTFAENFLELRRCRCKTLISIEHDLLSAGPDEIKEIINSVQSTALVPKGRRLW
ncbi:MAG: hypothetical protein KGH56_02555 [Patescibacteria group bacterium]|nr:hypothetical protein [Patescibacteria group bacterium]